MPNLNVLLSSENLLVCFLAIVMLFLSIAYRMFSQSEARSRMVMRIYGSFVMLFTCWLATMLLVGLMWEQGLHARILQIVAGAFIHSTSLAFRSAWRSQPEVEKALVSVPKTRLRTCPVRGKPTVRKPQRGRTQFSNASVFSIRRA